MEFQVYNTQTGKLDLWIYKDNWDGFIVNTVIPRFTLKKIIRNYKN